jgi:glutamine synthetase
MLPEEVRSAAQARAIVEERGLQHVKVGVFDADGILRGKYIDRDKFFSALEHGFGFCNVVLGWDSNDQLYDNVRYTGWHTAYPDAQVRLLPSSCRALPLEGEMLLFLGEFSGAAEQVCPRAVLRRVLDRAATLGLSASAAAEFEFFLFDETPDSVRDKGYRALKTLTPGYFGYSLLRSGVHVELHQALLQLAADMRMPIEACTPKPVRASSRRRCTTPRRWRRRTARRCSRPSSRCWHSGAA